MAAMTGQTQQPKPLRSMRTRSNRVSARAEYDSSMGSTNRRARRRVSITAVLDEFFFVFAGIAAIWLGWLLLGDSLNVGWFGIVYLVVFWAVLAYLTLPRLHRILTSIYVPDYFIGRTRTSDGLLGDPVNIALRGTESDLHTTLTQAGWIRADPVTLRSSVRIITSTVARASYPEAPVSPLYLFGHMQDFAYQQEVAGNPAKRHHVRFWRTPENWLLPGGARVDWLAAGTFDRAVGFSMFTLQITHHIDANIDIERDFVVHSLESSGEHVQIEHLRDFSTGYHSRNGGGDSVYTDGDLPIVEISAPAATTPVSAATVATTAATVATAVEHATPAAHISTSVSTASRKAPSISVTTTEDAGARRD